MIPETKKALSDSYAAMMKTDAWKDLEVFVEIQRDSSVELSDNKSASDVTLAELCEQKGIRMGMRRLIRHAEDIRDGV